MKEALTTIIIKDDNFKTVGIEMISPSGNTVYCFGIGASAPGYYKKTVYDMYYDEYLELNSLLTEKTTLKKCERQFFDIVLKALGESALDGVGFDFSVWRNRIKDIEAREDEIIKSIK